jgi:hypothetical protein
MLQIMGKGARGSFVLSPEIFCIKWTVSRIHGTYLQCVCMSENGKITYGTRVRRFTRIFFLGFSVLSETVFAHTVLVSNENKKLSGAP